MIYAAEVDQKFRMKICDNLRILEEAKRLHPNGVPSNEPFQNQKRNEQSKKMKKRWNLSKIDAKNVCQFKK